LKAKPKQKPREDFSQFVKRLATRVPAQHCIACNYLLTAATETNFEKKVKPKPGDWSVCIGCGALHRFTDTLRLRPASLAELAAEDADTRAELLRSQRAIRSRQ
jgi:hypothetical protein